MSAVAVSLAGSTVLCALLAGLVRVEVPTAAPEIVEDRVTEIPDPDPDGLRWECEEARVRAVAYLAEDVDHDDVDAVYDARRWIAEGFRAMRCPTPWPSGEEPQLACSLSGCGGRVQWDGLD